MNKQQFLEQLSLKLKGLPKEEISERISFYAEMIDDGMEEGLSEEEAVAKIGSVDAVFSQIVAEMPWSKIVKEKLKPQRSLKAWEITLIVLGFPLWFPLLMSAFAVVVSLYVVFWSVILSLWAVFVSLVAVALGLFIASIIFFATAGASSGVYALAVALFCAGLAIFSFYGCKYTTKYTFLLTKGTMLWGKKRLMRGEAQ